MTIDTILLLVIAVLLVISLIKWVAGKREKVQRYVMTEEMALALVKATVATVEDPHNESGLMVTLICGITTPARVIEAVEVAAPHLSEGHALRCAGYIQATVWGTHPALAARALRTMLRHNPRLGPQTRQVFESLAQRWDTPGTPRR